MKPRVWLAFWAEAHIAVLCPVFHPQVLLHRAAPNLLISQSAQILGKAMMQVQARTIYLASTNFIRFIWAHFSRLKSFWVTSIPHLHINCTCSVWCHLQTSWGHTQIHWRHWWYWTLQITLWTPEGQHLFLISIWTLSSWLQIFGCSCLGNSSFI